MNLDLTDEETAALLRELDALIDGDRYFMSPCIKLKPLRGDARTLVAEIKGGTKCQRFG